MSNCVSPFIVHSEKGSFPTRCGHCLNCKIQYANLWATRLLHESLYHDYSSFITLTYTDEYNPFELSVDVAQKWQKRLRQEYLRLGYSNKLKFFTCGEYGEESALIDGVGRPHYHSCVFGLNPYSDDTYELIKKTWKYQDYDLLSRKKIIEPLTYYNARYCAQYVLKKYNSDDYVKKIYGDKQQPFRIMSKGFGLQYFIEHKEEIEDRQLIYSGNGSSLISLPDYYKKRMEVTADYQHTLQALKNSPSYQEALAMEKKNKERQIFFKRGIL